MNNIEERVRKIICVQLNIPEKHLKNSEYFTDDLEADDFDITEIILALEEEFDINILEGDADNIKNATSAIEYINALTV